MKYIADIGLEIHAQLITERKLFGSSENAFAAEPNFLTDNYNLGMPGMLPVLNKAATEKALTAALALECNINRKTYFDRKNYFYYDLPKGYQITQYYTPLGKNGVVELASGKKIRIERIHIEEDSGKSVYKNGEIFIDYNRCGVPLIEIVTYPEMHSGDEASEFMRELKNILVLLGLNTGDLQKGSLRCDANVSVRKETSDELGVKTEIKNINSFRFVKQAVDHEIKRQIEIKKNDGEIERETRTYDEKLKKTRLLRKKEDTNDYRYFREPDLKPLIFSDEHIKKQRIELPELPQELRSGLKEKYKLDSKKIEYLINNVEHLKKFSSYSKVFVREEEIEKFNKIYFDSLKHLTEAGKVIDPEYLKGIISLLLGEEISASSASKLIEVCTNEGISPQEAVDKHNMRLVKDKEILTKWINEAIENNPETYERYKKGRKNLSGFFIGQVMKKSKGKADPNLLKSLIIEMLEN